MADGKGNERCDSGVDILDIKMPSSRLERMVIKPILAASLLLKERPDAIHVHDPELLIMGCCLKLFGLNIIYDAHEDLPKQILRKHWLPGFTRKTLSVVVKLLMRLCLSLYDAVVCATEGIAEQLQHKHVYVVKNYPLLSELHSQIAVEKKPQQICYAGGISNERGFIALLNALPENTRLALAGQFIPESFEHELKQHAKWEQVDYYGYLNRQEIAKLYAESIAGIVTLPQNSHYDDTLPIKLFEYMSASLPVICSDFPLWEDIVTTHECGVAVNPSNEKAVGDAIGAFLSDEDEASRRGNNGRTAIETIYNWLSEEETLFSLYSQLPNIKNHPAA